MGRNETRLLVIVNAVIERMSGIGLLVMVARVSSAFVVCGRIVDAFQRKLCCNTCARLSNGVTQGACGTEAKGLR